MRTVQLLFLVVSFLLSSTFIAQSSEIVIIAKAKEKKEKVKNEEEKEDEKIKEEPVNESDFKPILLGVLLENPQDFLNKKIKFRGKFSSFTTLALDYEGAMRKSKDYISLCIFRTDSKIPLSELKLAYPLKKAKDNEVIRDLEEGDLLEINGEVFSTALDEPWVDIVTIKKLESAKKDANEKLAEEKVKVEEKEKGKKIKVKKKTKIKEESQVE